MVIKTFLWSLWQKNYEHIKIILKSYQICLYTGIKIFNFRHYGMFKISINIIMSISNYASKSTIMCVMPVHYEHYEHYAW